MNTLHHRWPLCICAHCVYAAVVDFVKGRPLFPIARKHLRILKRMRARYRRTIWEDDALLHRAHRLLVRLDPSAVTVQIRALPRKGSPAP